MSKGNVDMLGFKLLSHEEIVEILKKNVQLWKC